MTNAGKAPGAKAKKLRAARRRTRERRIDGEEAAKGADRPGERGFLFEDPYWDDVFCSYYDPTLRTCCRR